MEVCRLCKGFSKTKCPLCGKKKLKRDMTLIEEAKIRGQEEAEHYRAMTWLKLRKFNMETTGIPSLDAELRKYHGEWLMGSPGSMEMAMSLADTKFK